MTPEDFENKIRYYRAAMDKKSDIIWKWEGTQNPNFFYLPDPE